MATAPRRAVNPIINILGLGIPGSKARTGDINRQRELEFQQQLAQDQQTRATAAGGARLGGQQGPFAASRMDPMTGLSLPLEQQMPADQAATVAQTQAALDPTAQAQLGALSPQAVAAQQFAAQQAMRQAQTAASAEARNQYMFEQYGGLTPQEHGSRVVELGGLQAGINQVEDLRTLSNQLGREVLPGAARGAYSALRGQALNALRVQFEAGALQAAELEFFESLLPEFGIWSSLSEAERNTQLGELQRSFINRHDTLAGITAGANQAQVNGRTLAGILGEPPPPTGAVPVESKAGERLMDVAETTGVPQAASGLAGLLSRFQESVRESGAEHRAQRESGAAR